MISSQVKHVYIVDDSSKVLEALTDSIAELPVKVFGFSDAMTCLKELAVSKCHLLITDINMPGMDGLELLQKVKRTRPLLPVIIITGYGDIPKAVRAMKDGAFDFIEKPFDEEALLNLVMSALQNEPDIELVGKSLTKREKEIFKLVIEGKSNKEIASLIFRSVKTVEYHRYRLMKKVGAHNLADLLRIGTKIGIMTE